MVILEKTMIENIYSREDVEGILFINDWWLSFFPNDHRHPTEIYEAFRHTKFNSPLFPVRQCLLHYMEYLEDVEAFLSQYKKHESDDTKS